MTDLLPTRPGSESPAATTPAPLPSPSARARRIRINLLDRPWAGHWTGVVVTPIRVPSLENMRTAWRSLMDEHPDAALACRVDERNWITVPAAERNAFVRATIVPIEDPAADDADTCLARSLHLLPADRPILIGVGERSLLLLCSHQIGDGATVTSLIRALLDGDADGLGALTRKADLPDVVRATRAQARGHGREWWSMARRRIAGLRGGGSTAEPADPTPGASPTRPARSEAGTADRTAVVSVRWTTADLQQISRWRTSNAKGMSITSVLTAATQRALVEAGLPMAADGFHSLVDLRRYLPDSKQSFLAGNLAKSVRIDADPTDLRAIGEASRTMVESARPVLSTVLGAMAGAVTRRMPSGVAPASADGPVAMTFNSMPALPGLSELPWLPGQARQYVGVGYPAGPRSITVFAMRMREHMQVTAAFQETLIDPELVRRILVGIPHRVDELVDVPPPAGA